jgi:hypothetical protein
MVTTGERRLVNDMTGFKLSTWVGSPPASAATAPQRLRKEKPRNMISRSRQGTDACCARADRARQPHKLSLRERY